MKKMRTDTALDTAHYKTGKQKGGNALQTDNCATQMDAAVNYYKRMPCTERIEGEKEREKVTANCTAGH